MFTYRGEDANATASGAAGLNTLGTGETAQTDTDNASSDETTAEQGPPEVQGDEVAGGTAEPGTEAEPAEANAGPTEPGDQAAVDLDALVGEGRTIFGRVCAACHGPAGKGAQGPALDGNEALGGASYVARTLVHGFGYMPPFGDRLSDEEIAAVGSFIRNGWSNDFGPLTTDEVAAQR
jgi:mono/diheme cytochrome c family protein